MAKLLAMTNRDTRVKARKRFGAAMRAAREAVEMTQTDLSTKLGMAQTQVSNYENGQHEPPPSTVFEIERLLRVKGGELSRHLGFLPVAQRRGSEQSTVGAILEDETLGEREREAIITLYKTLSLPQAGGGRKRNATISA